MSKEVLSKFDEVNARLTAFCSGTPGYSFTTSGSEEFTITDPSGITSTASTKGGKAKFSDISLQEKVLSFQVDTGSYLAIPITDQERENIRALMEDAPKIKILSPDAIRNFICKEASGQEIIDFLVLASNLELNPFKGEIILYKNKTDGICKHIVTKNAFTRRAAEHPDFKTYKGGVIVMRGEEATFKPGSFVAPNEKLVGGWATVYFRSDRDPIEESLNLSEYDRHNKIWQEKPGTMIQKCAEVAALRRAFPEELNGCYIAEEMGVDPAKEVQGEYKVEAA